jgi:hypothetical protein
LFAGELARSIGLVEDDLAAMPDHYYTAGQPLFGDRIIHQL